jgi:hypothetical protein
VPHALHAAGARARLRRHPGGDRAGPPRHLGTAEFAAWLRTQTSPKTRRRPYQERTITEHRNAAKALDRWMAGQKLGADFTACDTQMMNRFFADYL